MTDYREEAKKLIALLKKECVGPDGSLVLERTGTQVRGQHIFPDLGDTLPFLYYFGEAEFADSQVALYQKALADGMLVSQFPTLGIRGLVKSYEYTDLILGLVSYYEHAPGSERRVVLEDALKAAESAFALKTSPRSFYYPALGFHLPIVDTRDATLIECYTTVYRLLRNEEYLGIAKSIFTSLTGTPFFTRYGLFADYEPTNALMRLALRTRPETRRATLCKNTTNALFALLDLYRVTRDAAVLAALMKARDAVFANAAAPDGTLTERFVPGTGAGRGYLTASFPVIDFLADLSVTVPAERDRALREARRVADAWLHYQGETGLFPLWVGGSESFIDSETDMCIALCKLADAGGGSHYRDAAERCMEGFYRFHAAQGYPLGVHVDTGAVINKTQRTKFLCLSLKLAILKLEEAKGRAVYTHEPLFEILKDR